MAITARPIDLESTHGWPRVDLKIASIFVENAPAAAESKIFSRTSQKLQAFDALQAQLFKSAAYGANWDSYGAEAPSPNSVAAVQIFLGEAQALEILPTAIVASAEGGLAAYFIAGGRTSYIEFYNDGETIVAHYGADCLSVVAPIERDSQSITGALEAILAFLGADPAHASPSH